ncbi:MAG: GIY-YIG nuclease family protein [Thermoproteota archaeon]|nr:GIY-YIG nuclease family protein [Thermoproteota archaeon]
MNRTHVESVGALPARGIYTLVIFLSKTTSLNIGKLGAHNFAKGYYAYTGSALGPAPSSLPNRVSRHLQKKKNERWHIDYLLADENATVRAVIAILTRQRLECKLNRAIKESLDGRILVDGFGASDCKENCGSHLLYFGEKNVETKVISLYAEETGFHPTVFHPDESN